MIIIVVVLVPVTRTYLLIRNIPVLLLGQTRLGNAGAGKHASEELVPDTVYEENATAFSPKPVATRRKYRMPAHSSAPQTHARCRDPES